MNERENYLISLSYLIFVEQDNQSRYVADDTGYVD